jgi:hypothetical protein
VPKTCFIAMPVTTPNEYAETLKDDFHFNHVLETLMVPAVRRASYEPIRPVVEGADIIHAEIIRQLETADLVLCDISALNPNVFFELGIRTAVDKPVCIVKDNRTEVIPFDTSIMNVHTYEPSLRGWLLDEEVKALADHLRASAERSNDRNPMWTYFGLTTRAAFREGESPFEEKLDLILLALDSQPRPSIESVFYRNAATEDDVTAFKRSVAAANPTKRKLPTDQQVEFVDQAHKIGRKAKISSLSFNPGAVTASYVGDEFSTAERAELEELTKRYGMRLFLYKQVNMPGD